MATGTVTHALRKLYKAIVGQDIAKNNPTKIINDLADNWPEGITIESLSVTENDTYTAPEGKAYSPVTVNVSGGSSDFSTATVTVTNNTDTVIKPRNFPTLTEADTIFGEAELYPSESNDFEAVMYKGTARCYVCDHSYNIIPSAYVTVTGAIEKITDIEDEDWYCLITGDGTISVP